jgi:hypothetical protein
VGREHPHLPASLEAHQEHFGRAPQLLAADRGLYSEENERLAHQAGIKRIVLPQRVQEWASLARTGAAREAEVVQAGLSLSGGDRGAHQRAWARLRAGFVPRSRRGRDEQVGRMGHPGAQPEADRPNAGGAAGRMRPKEFEGGVRGVLPEFYP